jgi:hypothetical protein
MRGSSSHQTFSPFLGSSFFLLWCSINSNKFAPSTFLIVIIIFFAPPRSSSSLCRCNHSHRNHLIFIVPPRSASSSLRRHTQLHLLRAVVNLLRAVVIIIFFALLQSSYLHRAAVLIIFIFAPSRSSYLHCAVALIIFIFAPLCSSSLLCRALISSLCRRALNSLCLWALHFSVPCYAIDVARSLYRHAVEVACSSSFKSHRSCRALC